MNKIYKINKKGTDKILSLYWLVILTIIAGGIFAMVYLFYGAPYDVRETETNLFAEKIADCISKNGIIDSDFLYDKNISLQVSDNFLNKCNINFNVEDGYGDVNKVQYFYEVQFYTLADTENSAFSFNGGNSNWKVDCSIKKENGKDYSKLAKCMEKRFYASSDKKEQYLIKILSVVGKSEKNVKQ